MNRKGYGHQQLDMGISKLLAFTAFLLSIGSVSTHTIFQELYVNGLSQGRLNGIRVPNYNGPITDVTSNDVICNGRINPYHTPISTTVIKVAAGSQVSAGFHYTLTSKFRDNSDPIDPSHNDRNFVDARPLNLSKLYTVQCKGPLSHANRRHRIEMVQDHHDGLDSNGWAVQRLTKSQGKVSFTIPSCIPAGQYLLRVELIGKPFILLHKRIYPGAQFYMECAQLEITGGGNTSLAK
ncbi:hypothetical protein CVT25_004351, partial [Psilocybe cyanescens]